MKPDFLSSSSTKCPPLPRSLPDSHMTLLCNGWFSINIILPSSSLCINTVWRIKAQTIASISIRVHHLTVGVRVNLLFTLHQNKSQLFSFHTIRVNIYCLFWLSTKGDGLLRILKICKMSPVYQILAPIHTDPSRFWINGMIFLNAVHYFESSFFILLLFTSPSLSFLTPPPTHTHRHSLISIQSHPVYSVYKMLAEHWCFTHRFPLMSCQCVCVCMCALARHSDTLYGNVPDLDAVGFSGQVQCYDTWRDEAPS